MCSSPKHSGLALIAWAAIVFATLGTGSASALPGDQAQPIRITADEALRDDKSGFTRYEGNVVMNQGSLRIEAQRITVYHDAKAADKIIAEGSPAQLQQQPDPDKEPIKAHADIIEYYKSEDRVQLKHNAHIQQEGSTVTGETIDYYIAEQRVIAGSDTARADSRVEVIIPAQTATSEQTGDASGDPDSQ